MSDANNIFTCLQCIKFLWLCEWLLPSHTSVVAPALLIFGYGWSLSSKMKVCSDSTSMIFSTDAWFPLSSAPRLSNGPGA
jgi:hypothetical protein